MLIKSSSNELSQGIDACIARNWTKKGHNLSNINFEKLYIKKLLISSQSVADANKHGDDLLKATVEGLLNS